MDADFKPFSLNALYFSCGNYWTRNHTGKIFPEEPAWFNSCLPAGLRVLCKAKPRPCGDIPVGRTTSVGRGQWEGQCHGCPVCAGGWSPRFAAGQRLSGDHSRPEHLGLAEMRRWQAVICVIFEVFGMEKINGGMGSHCTATWVPCHGTSAAGQAVSSLPRHQCLGERWVSSPGFSYMLI